MSVYDDFLASKMIVDPPTGIVSPPLLPDVMMDIQRDVTNWALKRGRAAIMAGTGLGKSLMEIVWADTVAKETGRPVLHFAPLAVTAQMVREASKFGVSPQTITNYQKLSHFNVSDFGGVVLDEASILKNETGHYRNALIEACSSVPFRLAATATPAPNDFMELGNQAEFLGIMSYTDMLATFFVHDGGDTQKWRLKGHAENDFWRWMASWAVMYRKPSDLGYSDDGYNLPPLIYHQHSVAIEDVPNIETGTLFAMTANTMQERLAARRGSVAERVALAASLTPDDGPMVWWCNLNSESEALTKAIPGAVETKGSDPDDVKERKLTDFSEGRIRVLVTKPSVAGWGMNWQHCCNTGFVGLNDSWEQFYQAVRRFWRFGQTKPVNVHIVAAETEGATVSNIRRKEADADRMAQAMLLHMADMSSEAIRGSVRTRSDYHPEKLIQLPNWM